MNIPNLPIQIMAVTDTGGANAFFNSDLSHLLITEGNATADRLQAHFMTSASSCQQKSKNLVYIYNFLFSLTIYFNETMTSLSSSSSSSSSCLKNKIHSRVLHSVLQGGLGKEARNRTSIPHGGTWQS